jgi:uncharacterized protein YdeI (YjbR/CyaY-like superfamily)
MKNPKLDNFFLGNSNKWLSEMQKLREIVLSLPLTEEMKWGQPCYTHGKDRNIVLIHGFKEYCALLFIKGALMPDPADILIQQTENVQAGRQIRFTSLDQINQMEDTIKAYIANAIAVEESGVQVQKKETKDFPVAEELHQAFADDAAFKEAFEALTPGRQRAWLLHFSGAKQSATRVSRIEKARDKIFDGMGPLG